MHTKDKVGPDPCIRSVSTIDIGGDRPEYHMQKTYEVEGPFVDLVNGQFRVHLYQAIEFKEFFDVFVKVNKEMKR